MKTHILQLEPHDDAISARDKMSWSQAGRILLVLPAHSRVLGRRLDLALLLRHSQSLGAQLALVTGDPQVRFHARLLGISTFRNIQQAQKSRWKTPAGRRTSRLRDAQSARQLLASTRRDKIPFGPGPALRLGSFSLGVLAVLSLAAALLPSAEVRLRPETRVQATELEVQASSAAQGVNLAGIIPIHTLSVIVEGRDSLDPTGTARIAEHHATGQALFTNLTGRPVSVPAGTVVQAPASGTRFATVQDGQIPAGPGTSASLPIRALLPGRAGNLPAGEIQAIEGLLGVDLAVLNPEPTRGGSDRLGPAPSQADRSRLRDRLLADLQESALAEVQAGLQPTDLLLTSQPALARTLEESFDPPENEPTSLLSLTLRLEFQAQLVSGEDLRALAASVLDANLPDGYSPLPDTLQVELLSGPHLHDASQASLVLSAQRRIRAHPPGAEAARLALGLPPAQAGQRLADELPLSAPPDISLFPSWWPRLPILPLRITVISES